MSAALNTAYARSSKSQKRASSTPGCSASAAPVALIATSAAWLDRVAVDAGRDRGERDRARPALGRQRDRAEVAGREEVGLAGVAAAPDRADRVDDVASRARPPAAGRARVAGLAAAERPALVEELGPGGAMDRAVDAAAAEQARVGGVDDHLGARVAS